jgi:DNA replication protein DnaC
MSSAQTKAALKSELKRYLSPALLLLDEIAYLPIDQRGADLLFQVISQRYERGSNRPYLQQSLQTMAYHL